MKRKNIKLMILAGIVAASFTTNVVYAAKPTTNQKGTNKTETKQERTQESKQQSEQASKQGNLNNIPKEFSILSNRIDQIDDSYKKVDTKINDYLSTTGSAVTVGASTGTTTGSAVNASDTTETETTTGSSVDADTELENEYKNEDSQVTNSFYGKLNAIMNRLNTVKKQLGRLSSLDSEEVATLNGRITDLVTKVEESRDKVASLQSENVSALKSKLDKKIMEAQSIDSQKKSWKIRFSKSVNLETITSKNVMIVDSNNNIVDVDISYNKDSNEVIIAAKDGFIKSETYTILISSGVKSIDGKNLSNTIEKKFTVK